MQKKFKYCLLEERSQHGAWLWFLDGEIVNPVDRAFLGTVIYEQLSLVQILNLLGKEGWQVVNTTKGNNHEYTVLVMKEYFLGE